MKGSVAPPSESARTAFAEVAAMSGWRAENQSSNESIDPGTSSPDGGQAVQQLKRQPGKGLFVGGVKLPLALAELGLIDEYEFMVQPRVAGHGPTLFAGLSKYIDLKLVSRLEFRSGAVAMRYEPRR
ncbi:MAG TPA: dihydrofolate reductase family protein [Polyangiaceae bacterium]|nr:dihydrofolate reductase family protein [Polyangiaceae bacterium]